LRDDGELDLLKQLVEAGGWTIDSPAIEDNPFHWCLVAIDTELEIFGHNAARRRAAAELAFADRHDVPELYLIGFIYQLGSATDIHSRLARRERTLMVRAIERGR
jgi:hypothetical protein